MTIKHTHWLYGSGPDKVVEFNHPIELETECKDCIHDKVCKRDMVTQCNNYQFGCSGAENCHSCLHKYTRWDKDRLPCFFCKDFLGK